MVGRSPPVKLVFLSDPRFGRAKKKTRDEVPKWVNRPPPMLARGDEWENIWTRSIQLFCLVESRFCFSPSTNAMDVMIVDLQPFSVDRNCVYFRKFLAILEQSTSFAS